ncbi:GerW family sporulation protein [Cuneatibacter sp. NSJ-177]|uniref:GerW family sporulation protein n=1 Tax=Cuneatibacter sp. NSJ-177 TaxID=2931401 RepID=UPI001FD41F9B|nr:GerW family sporulation protein [Cuneatibacter sp. NSJ-177]MCJ7834072.1 GerW family sporulation protein [Cuneatibacter sp. NSJ-177]
MADNNFSTVVESLLKGLDGFATAKTVVGDAVQIKDTIILPLVDISFGVGAGAALNEERKKNSGGGGMAAKMSPSAVLVIQNGMTRLVNIKNQDTVTKILDMAPDLIDRFKKNDGSVVLDPEMEQAVEDVVKEEK